MYTIQIWPVDDMTSTYELSLVGSSDIIRSVTADWYANGAEVLGVDPTEVAAIYDMADREEDF